MGVLSFFKGMSLVPNGEGDERRQQVTRMKIGRIAIPPNWFRNPRLAVFAHPPGRLIRDERCGAQNEKISALFRFSVVVVMEQERPKRAGGGGGGGSDRGNVLIVDAYESY